MPRVPAPGTGGAQGAAGTKSAAGPLGGWLMLRVVLSARVRVGGGAETFASGLTVAHRGSLDLVEVLDHLVIRCEGITTMTNWCSGSVRVLANSEILAQVREDFPVFGLEAVAPIPRELKGLYSNSAEGAENGDIEVWRAGEGPDGMRDRVAVSATEQARLREHYGVVTQDDWARREWGTRWILQEQPWADVDGALMAWFTTPWSPPDRVVATLSARYRDVTFVLTYGTEYIGSGWGVYFSGNKVEGGFAEFCMDCVMREPGTNPREVDDNDKTPTV